MSLELSRVLNQVLTGIWLVDERKVQGYMPYIARYLRGEQLNDDSNDSEPIKKAAQPYYIDRQTGVVKKINSSWDMADFGSDDIPDDTTIVIPIKGAISKYNYCGTPGSSSIANFIKRLDAMSNVNGVILDMDTPGGSAEGTRNLSEAIQNFSKPIVAYIDELCASAGYWIASATDKIIATHDTAEIGSIGTYCSFYDLRGWKDFEGIKWHEIYATKSTAKNQSFREALNGKPEKLRAEVDVINEAFINGVKQGRPNISEDVFDGRCPFAVEAKELGLIDEIGPVQLAFDAIDNLKLIKSTNQIKNMSLFSSNKKYKVSEEIQAVLNLEDDKEIELSQDHLDTISSTIKTANEKIGGHDQFIKELKDEHKLAIDAVQDKLTKAENDLTTANDATQAAETKIKTLENQIAKRAGAALPHPELSATDDLEQHQEDDSWSEEGKAIAKAAGLTD